MNAPTPVPYTVLGGYLGAGKTTLLNRLLHDNQGLRVALLINDFGAINIDAELIESETDQQINLTNGCVCCGLSDGFDEAIANLLASTTLPEHIVVEASGVADVHSLAQYGNTPGLALDAVVVVADALTVRQKANDKYVAQTVRRQLAAADLLLLNKVDLVSAEQLESLRAWLTPLCNSAPIIPTEFCVLPEALLLGERHTRELKKVEVKKPMQAPPIAQHSVVEQEHNHAETYSTWHYQTDDLVERASIERFLQALPKSVIRGKGFFATLDSTQGHTEIIEWHQVGKQQRLTAVQKEAQQKTTLVAIGLAQELNATELNALAARHLIAAL